MILKDLFKMYTFSDVTRTIMIYYGESLINKGDNHGRTTLFIACQNSSLAAFNKLLEYSNIQITK